MSTSQPPPAADERSPLLERGRQRVAGERRDESPPTKSKSISSRIRDIPVFIRLAPLVALFSLSIEVPLLTILEVIDRILCVLWYERHDPASIPPTGEIPTEMCKASGPFTYSSTFLSTRAVLVAIAAFMVTSFIGQFGALVGRRPIVLLLVLANLVTISSFTAFIFIPNSIAALGMVAIWLIVGSFADVLAIVLISNMMVIDTASPSSRASQVSVIMGSMVAGEIPSFSIGGYIHRKGGVAAVCFTAVGLAVAQLLYASSPLVVPETFSSEKREAAREERRDRHRQARERSLERWEEQSGDATRVPKRLVRKTYESLQAVIDPVLRLKPIRKPDGSRKYRLTVLGVAYLLASVTNGYINSALIAWFTFVLKKTIEEKGFIFTWIAAMQFTGMIIVFPLLSKWSRVLYARFIARRQERSPMQINGEPIQQQDPRLPEGDVLSNPESELSSAHFDVYLLRWCYLFIALFYGAIALARTNAQIAAVAVTLTMFGGAHPSLLSIAAASVNPIQSGEAVAGIEMVGTIGRLVSPLIIGPIQTKIMLKSPHVLWFSMMLAMLVVVLITFLIRDEDRYISVETDTPEQESLLPQETS